MEMSSRICSIRCSRRERLGEADLILLTLSVASKLTYEGSFERKGGYNMLYGPS